MASFHVKNDGYLPWTVVLFIGILLPFRDRVLRHLNQPPNSTTPSSVSSARLPHRFTILRTSIGVGIGIMIQPSILQLPVELRLNILEYLPDLQSLKNAILAHSVFY